ncbi:MAG: hypothetical protein WCK51_05540 [Armatimonadota bacterium]
MSEDVLYWVQGSESERGPLSLTDLHLAARFGNLSPNSRVRLSSGEFRLAKELAEFDYLPSTSSRFPTTTEELDRRRELDITRSIIEYMITSWILLLVGAVFLPLFVLPASFVFGYRAHESGSKTAWLPTSIALIAWIVVAILAINKSWSTNQW